jgi:DNA processing protein
LDIFAAPNNIYSRESMGVNKLIQEGAKIYLNPSDLLLDYMRNLIVNNKKEDIVPPGNDLTSLEEVILVKIKDNPMTLDKLLFVLQEDKSEILETMSIMELEGKIINNK